MNQYAITYQAANRRAGVKVVDRYGALKELERILHFAPKTSKAYTKKIRTLIDSGKAGEKYEFFDGYIIVIANEAAARADGIAAAREAVEKIAYKDDLSVPAERRAAMSSALRLIDALATGATNTTPEGGE